MKLRRFGIIGRSCGGKETPMDAERHEITIEHGLPESQRDRAAQIVYDAFRHKLEPLVGPRERGVRLISVSLQPDRAIVATQQGQVIGLAGLCYGGGEFLRFRWSIFAREFGWLRAAPRAFAARFALGSKRRSARSTTTLTVEAIAVDSSVRGMGIGTTLLEAVFELAADNGLDAVRLEVVDTNPDARRLYERLGFEPAGTVRLPLLERIVGFSAWTTMVKKLTGPSR